MSPTAAYPRLAERFERIAHLDNALGILHWDQDTMMPEGAAPARSDALATLKVIRHELLVDPALADLLPGAEEETRGDAWRAANVREMRRQYVHATAVPADLVAAASKALSASELVWRLVGSVVCGAFASAARRSTNPQADVMAAAHTKIPPLHECSPDA